MPIKPGPIQITIGSHSVQCDNISVSYETQPFDRVEFDHEKLKSAPLSTGTTPIIISLLGGVPAEITIDFALQGMVPAPSAYIPRPLAPNVYPTDDDNIKQRVNIVRYRVSANSPEAASPASAVDGIFSYLETHKNQLAKFTNRLAIFGTTIAYETLLAAQTDNIETLYFTTGISFTSPDGTASNIMVVDGQITDEFDIPNAHGGYDLYRGFELTLEERTVSAASAS